MKRVVCADRFAFRHRNTILECLTRRKERRDRTCTYCVQLQVLLPLMLASSPNLQQLLCINNKRPDDKHDFLLLGVFVCNCTLHVREAYSGKAGNENQIWKKGVESLASGLTFVCTVAPCMCIIRWRLPSIPQLFPFTLAPASPPPPLYYQPYCNRPSHSSLFFTLTEKQKGPVLSAMCWLFLMAQSQRPHNTTMVSRACFGLFHTLFYFLQSW